MWRGKVWQLVAAISALAAFSCGGADPGRARSNLLLVVLDTTRSDRLGCYGGDPGVSTCLDGLARRGVRFENAYAQSSLTPVSVASLLSGCRPFRTGVRSLFSVGKSQLSPDVPYLFERLARAGARTAGFVSAQPMGSQYGLGRGFELYADDLSETAKRHGLTRFDDAPQRPAEETIELAATWLRENAAKPFALMVHLFDAHDPSFVPPRAFLAERGVELPQGFGRALDAREQQAFYSRPASLIELYDAEIAYMDSEIERLLEVLEDVGALEQTLICVLADHGESLGDHGYWTHGLLFEEQLRVPWILAGPGLPQGEVCKERVQLIDVFPTLCELLDLPFEAGQIDGVSRRPALFGRAETTETCLYAEVHHAPNDPRGRPPALYSVTLGPWKYVHDPRPGGTSQLFDLEQDPLESRDLLAQEPETASSLHALLQEWGAIQGSVQTLEGIPERELELLRELGYAPQASDDR